MTIRSIILCKTNPFAKIRKAFYLHTYTSEQFANSVRSQSNRLCLKKQLHAFAVLALRAIFLLHIEKCSCWENVFQFQQIDFHKRFLEAISQNRRCWLDRWGRRKVHIHPSLGIHRVPYEFQVNIKADTVNTQSWKKRLWNRTVQVAILAQQHLAIWKTRVEKQIDPLPSSCVWRCFHRNRWSAALMSGRQKCWMLSSVVDARQDGRCTAAE